MKNYLLIASLMLAALTMGAQTDHAPLTAEERQEVVDSISTILQRAYVFEDIGQQIADLLRQNAAEGKYQSVTDPQAFAQMLTEDVRAINDDRHLRVGFNPEAIADRRQRVTPEDSLAGLARDRRRGQLDNHGFQEVKILDGNIGYLNLTGFYGVDEYSGATAAAAMNFLANTDALIIDLRSNCGGSPAMIQLLTSYLYDSERIHLNNFESRIQGEITQTWTLPYVPGKRRPDVDVYVLTSARTFSAAEEFSYNLRNLERATLVGEVTGGGAHPGCTMIATDRYTVWVPTGRAVNPISNTNWEGTGVQPHVEVPAPQALTKAKMLALEKLMKDSDGPSRFAYEWALDGLRAEHEPLKLDPATMKSCASSYGPRSIEYRDGQLYYSREGRPAYRMIPMKEDVFMFEEISYFRLNRIRDGDQVVAVLGMYDNGRTDRNERSERRP